MFYTSLRYRLSRRTSSIRRSTSVPRTHAVRSWQDSVDCCSASFDDRRPRQSTPPVRHPLLINHCRVECGAGMRTPLRVALFHSRREADGCGRISTATVGGPAEQYRVHICMYHTPSPQSSTSCMQECRPAPVLLSSLLARLVATRRGSHPSDLRAEQSRGKPNCTCDLILLSCGRCTPSSASIVHTSLSDWPLLETCLCTSTIAHTRRRFIADQ